MTTLEGYMGRGRLSVTVEDSALTRTWSTAPFCLSSRAQPPILFVITSAVSFVIANGAPPIPFVITSAARDLLFLPRRHPARTGANPEAWTRSSFAHYAMGLHGAVEIESEWRALERTVGIGEDPG